MADRRDSGAARAPRTLRVFREHEADWMLVRILGSMSVDAAEVGACFEAARRIDERDPDSWPCEWARTADPRRGGGLRGRCAPRLLLAA